MCTQGCALQLPLSCSPIAERRHRLLSHAGHSTDPVFINITKPPHVTLREVQISNRTLDQICSLRGESAIVCQQSRSYFLIIRSMLAMVELEGREYAKHHQHHHMRNRRPRYRTEPRQQHRSRLQQQPPSLTGVTTIATAVGMVCFSFFLTPVEGFLSSPSVGEVSLATLRLHRPNTVGIRRARGCSTGRTMVSSVHVVPYGTGKEDVSEAAAASLGEAVRPDFPILYQVSFLLRRKQ